MKHKHVIALFVLLTVLGLTAATKDTGTGTLYYASLTQCIGCAPTQCIASQNCLPYPVTVDTGSTLATLAVPAGTYLVNATAAFYTTKASSTVSCYLVVGGNVNGHANIGTPRSYTTIPAAGYATLPVQWVWTTTGKATFTLDCGATSPVNVGSVVTIATPVGAIVQN